WSEIPANGTSTRGLKSPAALLDVQAAPTHEHHNHSHKNLHLEFNIKALEESPQAFNALMNSIEKYLTFEHVEKLRYEQYGLNDYFWQVEKHPEQWKNASENTTEPSRISVDKLPTKSNIKHHSNHQHAHEKSHVVENINIILIGYLFHY
ncbi:MAG: hypothetical protein EB150_09635, partial [Nitrososphaeria archaeon]|nr:hypothetical protein [Nitrososphaeria archaeon]